MSRVIQFENFLRSNVVLVIGSGLPGWCFYMQWLSNWKLVLRLPRITPDEDPLLDFLNPDTGAAWFGCPYDDGSAKRGRFE